MSAPDTPSSTYEPKKRWFDPAAAILMALATLSTAWCTYQSSKWNGLSTDAGTTADMLQRKAAAFHLEGNQASIIRIQLFTQMIDAQLEGNDKLANFYRERFPPDLRKAYEGWLEQKPFENPRADASPFVPHLYQQRYSAEMRQALADSASNAAEEKRTKQIASKYLGNTVLLAMVLFFAGTAGRFDTKLVRQSTLFFAIAIYAYVAVRMLTLPIISGVVD